MNVRSRRRIHLNLRRAMDPTVYFMILFLGILGTIRARDFYVIAPSSLRLNSEEIIGVAADGPSGGFVSIYIQDHPGKRKNISEKHVQVNPGKPNLFNIRLDPRDFPQNFLTSPASPKLITLNAHFLNFHKEILIPISGQSGYVFIQTDKPIYNPDERVFIQIIPLDEDSLPSQETLRLQIRNPDGSIVEQRYLTNQGGNAFVSFVYNFPTYSGLGEWSARVNYGYNFMQNSTVYFQVEEYVLPFFTVELETPDVILPSDEAITIKVSAKYSYGKKVKGFVSFRIGPKTVAGEVIYKTTSPKELQDGSYRQTFPISSLWDQATLPFSAIEGSRLYVEATVVDSATGNEEKAVDSRCVFATNPFDVSFKRCLRDFKPGFTSVVEADITYKNGQPASGASIIMEATTDRNRLLNIINAVSETDANGRVSFGIHPETTHQRITAVLWTPTSEGLIPIGTVVLTASENDAYLALARDRPPRLKPGDLFGRLIHTKPAGISNIYFVVVARGKILIMDKLPEGEFLDPKVTFQVTYEMVPNFRVLVFAHHGGKLLADSLKIDVENVCHPDTKVSIDTQFDLKEPGFSGKVIVQGVKGTSVGLIGVDEAVYALSKKDILTKEKVFKRLASHDLGCGPGSGKTVDAILGNAGLTMATNNFSPSHSHSCLERKRRKRSVFVELVEIYSGFERHCCSLGMEDDPASRSCEERKAIVHSYLNEEEYLNCSRVFLECCKYARRHFGSDTQVLLRLATPKLTKMRAFGRDLGILDGIEPIFVDHDDLEKIEANQTLRTDFKQTWFHVNVLIGPDNREEVGLTLPDSITTWVIQGVSVSPRHGVCVADPQRLESTKKIFIHLNLPYSVVRNEQIEIPVTVFNYGPMPIAATVYMYGAEGLCSGTAPNKRSETKQIVVDRLSSGTVTFPVIPLKAQVIPIRVVMISALGSDIVQKNLNVIPEGIAEEISITVRMDPTNQQKREQRTVVDPPYLIDKIDPTQNIQVTTVKLCTPENFVPGTESCSVSAIGDVYGPAIETTVNNPDNLLQMPGGCGEQNMVKLAPTLYTMRYLKVTGRLTAESEEKGYDYMRKGYAHQVTEYRKNDGSYSAFKDRPTSTWLTAFVIKVFCQASELIYIDGEVLCSGVRWLMNNQQSDGSFTENHNLYAPDLMGGLEGRAPMTAFVLIALQECKCDEENLYLAKQRAIHYLENNLNSARSPLSAAIIAYALALSDSELEGVANEKLLSMATFDEARNWLYWPTENSAQDIQTAGYALLTQLLFDDMERSTSIVNWLNTQQLQSGSYKSTQDTVMALQAMSEYSIRAQMPSINLETNISSSNDRLLHRKLLFDDKNALVLRDVKVNKVGGTLFIKTKGNGVGSLSVKLRYNVLVPPEICKFDLRINITNKRNEDVLSGLRQELEDNGISRRKSTDRKLRYKIEVCVRYLGAKDAEMSMVDVGLFTGFWPDEEELKRIPNDLSQLIRKVELTDRSVVFYLEKVSNSDDYCFSFNVTREFIVGNTQMKPVKVYDFYNPDEKCTKFYKPESNSPLLRTLCTNGICQCAEGGCPPKSPFSEIYQLPERERRDTLKQTFCDAYDYVWKGKLNSKIKEEGGFLYISFLVEDVIKAGIERTEDIEGETRTLLAQGNCVTANMYAGVDYLLLGKDGQRYMNEHGVLWYRYLLDQTSVVHMWTSLQQVANSTSALDMQRYLNHVTKDLKRNGCDY